jgi:hypothetical protein
MRILRKQMVQGLYGHPVYLWVHLLYGAVMDAHNRCRSAIFQSCTRLQQWGRIEWRPNDRSRVVKFSALAQSPNLLFPSPLLLLFDRLACKLQRGSTATHMYVTCALQSFFSIPAVKEREKGVVDGWASSDAACQAGGLGSIPGPGQTYV